MAAPLDPAVARARFAVFVDRAMREARDAGLSDRKVALASGIATSTFHRWRTNQGTEMPKVDKVRAFCLATGASFEDAMAALGMTDTAPEPTPEAPIPRDVRIILRRLADPNTPEDEAEFLRKSLQMLAGRAAADTRAEAKGRDAS